MKFIIYNLKFEMKNKPYDLKVIKDFKFQAPGFNGVIL